MKNDQKSAVEDATKRHLFLAKYRDVVLIKDGVTYIITGVEFSSEREVWTVAAKHDKQDKYDNRVYTVDPEKFSTIHIDVSNKKGGLGSLIKAFNGS